MYIRLTQPGFETLTGMFGSVHFTNGVSDADLPVQMALGLMAITSCEEMVAVVMGPPAPGTSKADAP